MKGLNQIKLKKKSWFQLNILIKMKYLFLCKSLVVPIWFFSLIYKCNGDELIPGFESSQFVFEEIEIQPSPNQDSYVGRFIFINRSDDAIKFFGDDPPNNNKFEPQFADFQIRDEGVWRDLEVGHSEIGVEKFSLVPKQAYEFKIDLSGFKEQKEPLVGRVGFEGVWSSPFILDWVGDRESGDFEKARTRNINDLRNLLLKSGIRKNLVLKNNFIDVLVSSLLRQASNGDGFKLEEQKKPLDVAFEITSDGLIRIDFATGNIRDQSVQYRGWIVLNPSRFSLLWLNNAKQKLISVVKRGNGLRLQFGGSGWDNETVLYICIDYESSIPGYKPSLEESKDVMEKMLSEFSSWFKEMK